MHNYRSYLSLHDDLVLTESLQLAELLGCG